ncbi:alkanesulfonate monooxygenase SsuD/methylene tetrahydromethanopterin reductase-like flavin-dependent oxidoreductase (luciferase family) [Kribbella aluminosa]|uniref:Alkanesulfonate monooxygenase SsuD/methylene tetrahydromethanopterin reductase-like flavin-dependent oxidoreductase (Luciferase family) n=1 Tax=Kribbella aluminosa TaxID=416017 RepID=A0ABS4UDC4_9ACTN|nr:LLM class flavin-dependent oxidoreductase [Kribbella aluminosa]MBP2349601.1 alkanesulfonate monooxygenase SsuD/methylene tetrahydromethanopterin reductase-like flavin-dependent oxidoreductase (luciferase family) [Kribbella aluminosa]
MIVGLEIDGAGADPAAWRGAEVDPRAILTGALAVRAAQRAEAAGVDLVTFADALEAPEDVPEQVSVRLDALGLAARVAPATERIGLLPAITVTHTEPFHVQASVATLDHISGGRAGWVADVSTSAAAAEVVGRRQPVPVAETWREARYVVDVSRRLWDSWEDDAIVRDAATGRYVDRERLHYVDFVSPTFSVKGPSIVPRPPQGHPVTAIRVNTPAALEAARDADLVLLPDSEDVAAQIQALRANQRQSAAGGRSVGGGQSAGGGRSVGGGQNVGSARSVGVTADAAGRAVSVTPDSASPDQGSRPGVRPPESDTADRVAGVSRSGPVVLVSVGVRPHVDGVDGLVAAVEEWVAAGVDGVHLRPGSLELDVPVIADELLPRLRELGLVGAAERGGSLRGRLGLGRPRNTFSGSAR